MNSPGAATQQIRHAGPPLGLVSSVFVLLFLAGLYPVTMYGGQPYFPGPWESQDTIAAFFQTRPTAVLIGAALHFGAAMALGIFTATVVSRLHFLGVRAAGATIALFGGFATAFTMLASSSVLWALAHPGVTQDRSLVQALYWLDQGLGGSGFSVPFGLLIAGITIPAVFLKLLPKWLVFSGIALAVIGELSWLNLIMPKALFTCPADPIPGLRLADRRRVCAPNDDRTRRIRDDGLCRSRQGRISVSATMNVLAWITAANAALFWFGAVQHAGLAIGPFHEPRIVPAAIVEAICGAALAYAATALFRRTRDARRVTVVSNVIALVGVMIGLVALAVGAGPRTATNDLYHRLMLAAIGVSFVLLYVSRARTRAIP